MMQCLHLFTCFLTAVLGVIGTQSSWILKCPLHLSVSHHELAVDSKMRQSHLGMPQNQGWSLVNVAEHTLHAHTMERYPHATCLMSHVAILPHCLRVHQALLISKADVAPNVAWTSLGRSNQALIMSSTPLDALIPVPCTHSSSADGTTKNRTHVSYDGGYPVLLRVCLDLHNVRSD
jgi:hypothetical protein